MLLPVLALSIGTATISYFVVERPILSLKDRVAWWSGPPKPAVLPVPQPAVPQPAEHGVAEHGVAEHGVAHDDTGGDAVADHDAPPGDAVVEGAEEPA
jgi:hypothetical protein